MLYKILAAELEASDKDYKKSFPNTVEDFVSSYLRT